jgi:hypothetical protein
MSNVIPLILKDPVIVVSFVLPTPTQMNMTGDENIVLESHNGQATAWVPAKDVTQAKAKLSAMITNITEWLD